MSGRTTIYGIPFSIRFFLNKRLKGYEQDGHKRYPVYAQVNFDRKNVQLPVVQEQISNNNLYLPELAFESFLDYMDKEIAGSHLSRITLHTDEMAILAKAFYHSFYLPVKETLRLYHNVDGFDLKSLKYVLFNMTRSIHSGLFETLNSILKGSDLHFRKYQYNPNVFGLKNFGVQVDDDAAPWYYYRGTELYEALFYSSFREKIPPTAAILFDTITLIELLGKTNLTALEWKTTKAIRDKMEKTITSLVKEDQEKLLNDFSFGLGMRRLGAVYFDQTPDVYIRQIEDAANKMKNYTDDRLH
ncbi:MAG: hypothetical protein ACE362_19875 [Phaeodactylibacter xiamenensis]|uniref:Uncharacterized protein n=1 Tax=Phaeodactylibacter xiamenensis TaxID=1524460 RepID=A0A098S0Q9_9BACT|nr:hypothetical protein [Phaeodactylibacter xiamenensis]KGE85929.1 hypothetical protein IX84_25325 [Phaeodactylibacter xiamenensis]MCR9051279.1 hypothetical protein [bacterium]